MRDPMRVLCPGHPQALHPHPGVLLPVLRSVQNLARAATKGQGHTETAGERPGMVQGMQTFFNPEIAAARCAGCCSAPWHRAAPNAGLGKHGKEQSRHRVLDSSGMRVQGSQPARSPAPLVPIRCLVLPEQSHNQHVHGPGTRAQAWEQQWCGRWHQPCPAPSAGWAPAQRPRLNAAWPGGKLNPPKRRSAVIAGLQIPLCG